MIDIDEADLFRQTLTGLVHAGSVDDALVQFGWTDLLASDEQLAVAPLFETLGEAGVRSAALAWLVTHHLAAPDPAAPGAPSAPVLIPFGGTGLPGRPAGDVVRLDGVVLEDGAADGGVLVAAGAGPDLAIGRATGPAPEPVAGIDPALGIRRITGEGTWESGGPPLTGDPARQAWEAARAAGCRALGHQLLGGMRAALEMTRQHACDRTQFGVPIGSFQAVRHRLAEARVAVDVCEAALQAAWARADVFSAVCAKAIAGRSAAEVVRHCQQVLGGIGYTAEHPFAGYARRLLALDQLFGSARSWTAQLGGQFRAGSVPELIGITDA